VEIYSLRKNGARGVDVLGTVPPMGDATCSAQETLAHLSELKEDSLYAVCKT